MAHILLWLVCALPALSIGSSVSAKVLLKPEAAVSHGLIARDDWKFATTIDPSYTLGVDEPSDNSTYDYPDPPPSVQLCKRAFTVQCSTPRPDDCYSSVERTRQLPLRQLSKPQQQRIWNYATSRGSDLKKNMGKTSFGMQGRRRAPVLMWAYRAYRLLRVSED